MNKKILYVLVFTIVAVFCTSIILFSQTSTKSKTDLKGSIIIEMTNFNNNDGFVLIALYGNEKDFKSNSNSVMREKTTIKENKSIVEFKDVPYGKYAISGFHDENDNQKLDTGMFGIPKEGLFASNNAKGNFGPVKFEDAKFELKTPKLKMEIKVIYY